MMGKASGAMTIEFRGETLSIKEFAHKFELHISVVYSRIKTGMSVEDIYNRYSRQIREEDRLPPLLIGREPELFPYNGEMWTIRQFSDKLDYPISTIYARLKRNETLDEIAKSITFISPEECLSRGLTVVGRRVKVKKKLENGITVFENVGILAGSRKKRGARI